VCVCVRTWFSLTYEELDDIRLIHHHAALLAAGHALTRDQLRLLLDLERQVVSPAADAEAMATAQAIELGCRELIATNVALIVILYSMIREAP